MWIDGEGPSVLMMHAALNSASFVVSADRV
jgi:hypothetical protein